MTDSCFHPSIEGAQHGAKSLPDFLDFAKAAGATGAQPSNFMLESGDGFQKAQAISEAFEARGMTLDGVSAHCPFWVHTTAWTASPTVRPFLPEKIRTASPSDVEKWTEDYLLRMFDLLAELDVKVVPMFWGVAFGWEIATGYPWGFWAGPGYDLIAEGRERFVTKTRRLRERAAQLGLRLCHEIHPGTAAMTADDFLSLVEGCDGDPVLAVNADPSHCWEGENWESRFLKVASRIFAVHVKNFVIRPGFPLRAMQPSWPSRGMQFTDLASGDLNLNRYAELMLHSGYVQRFAELTGRSTAPLVVEAESAFRDLDDTSAQAIDYVRRELCFPPAAGSFEAGMGA
jgi:sugar phosphate isomerase/epimerase